MTLIISVTSGNHLTRSIKFQECQLIALWLPIFLGVDIYS
ncbi:hypothetical protein EGR_11146 [Echinococcus granulosus]|uniref:Uncharacterized protein n=1 Tax=Echinococcus granulosus TaxID=6210 RepID=W6U6P8_ECHGR|nr:hypothetical protein EGR_11146 [Echinococcus granulosus]EUB53997.1 hypothetical protein EGR_11146 [Echinococcus granulosus]